MAFEVDRRTVADHIIMGDAQLAEAFVAGTGLDPEGPNGRRAAGVIVDLLSDIDQMRHNSEKMQALVPPLFALVSRLAEKTPVVVDLPPPEQSHGQ